MIIDRMHDESTSGLFECHQLVDPLIVDSVTAGLGSIYFDKSRIGTYSNS